MEPDNLLVVLLVNRSGYRVTGSKYGLYGPDQGVTGSCRIRGPAMRMVSALLWETISILLVALFVKNDPGA